MKTLPIDSVASWTKNGQYWVPAAIDTACPQCGRLSTLVFETTSNDPGAHLICGRVRCSRCRKHSSLVVVHPGTKDQDAKCAELCIHPSPAQHRSSILEEVPIDDRLTRAYRAALDAYNAGIWSAAVTSCRRTLEGVVKLQLPEEKRSGPLAQQLKLLPAHVDLTAPLLRLADVLKDGGNVGAHFDLDIEPDAAFAAVILDFTEYVLEYLFLIPKHAEDLKSKLEAYK